MIRKITITISLIIILAIGFRLKFGVYRHNEFVWENYLFMKHRLIWKWRFYSPIGMSDLTLNDLTEEEKKEEILFNEFIIEQGLSK